MIHTLDAKNKNENLDNLKIFYETTWGDSQNKQQATYIKNDECLYQLFQNKEQVLDQCKNLNSKYSTRIGKVEIETIAEIIEEFIRENKTLNPESILEESKKLDIKKDYKSFITKYCHWYYEINNDVNNHFPIYDKHVRYGLIYYNVSYLYIEDIHELKKLVDEFIEKYLPHRGNDRIEIKNTNKYLRNTISIYRLVDKFLWLQYKKEMEKNNKKP